MKAVWSFIRSDTQQIAAWLSSPEFNDEDFMASNQFESRKYSPYFHRRHRNTRRLLSRYLGTQSRFVVFGSVELVCLMFEI